MIQRQTIIVVANTIEEMLMLTLMRDHRLNKFKTVDKMNRSISKSNIRRCLKKTKPQIEVRNICRGLPAVRGSLYVSLHSLIHTCSLSLHHVRTTTGAHNSAKWAHISSRYLHTIHYRFYVRPHSISLRTNSSSNHYFSIFK